MGPLRNESPSIGARTEASNSARSESTSHRSTVPASRSRKDEAWCSPPSDRSRGLPPYSPSPGIPPAPWREPLCGMPASPPGRGRGTFGSESAAYTTMSSRRTSSFVTSRPMESAGAPRPEASSHTVLARMGAGTGTSSGRVDAHAANKEKPKTIPMERIKRHLPHRHTRPTFCVGRTNRLPDSPGFMAPHRRRGLPGTEARTRKEREEDGKTERIGRHGRQST